MGNYGRNFQVLQDDDPETRLGRYINGSSTVPQGAPVGVADAAVPDLQKRLPFGLLTGAQAPGPVGIKGVALYQPAFNAYRGVDPVITRPSDLIDVPASAPCQLVSGKSWKFRFVNTVDRNFLGARHYLPRIMVAGVSIATPTVDVGDFLTPGVGNDTDGYWAGTSDVTKAWFVVTFVDELFVEAQMQW